MMMPREEQAADEPAAKRPCSRIDSAQDLLNLMNATTSDGEDVADGAGHDVTPDSPVAPPTFAARASAPTARPQIKKEPGSQKAAGETENWRRAAEAPPPPPDQLVLDEQVPDDTLNVAALFCDGNFKSALPNERGRGALAAAALCLLERLKVAPGHVHVVRSGQHVDRWLLNRMPGRTDALLHFVNGIMVRLRSCHASPATHQLTSRRHVAQGGMLGLKPFSSWRALARSLGDSRDYLPARHWRCLELKGGGVNASAKQPWQAYRAVSGHFDRLANELETCLMTRQADAEKCINEQAEKEAAAAKAAAATREARAKVAAANQLQLSGQTGPSPPDGSGALAFRGVDQRGNALLTQQHTTVGPPIDNSDRTLTEHKASRQLQFIAKRENLLGKGQGAGASSATGKAFKSRKELSNALQSDWNTIMAALNLVM